MKEFEAKPKKWGNSLGVTIPKEIVEEEGVSTGKKVKVFILGRKKDVKDVFGSLEWRKPTQKIMDEIDKGWE